jgi:sortase A
MGKAGATGPGIFPTGRSAIRTIEQVLFGIGLLILFWCAWRSAEARVYQASHEARFEEHRSPGSPDETVAPTKRTAIREGEALGRIEIPRIGLAAVVAEGEKEATLRLAVGHIPGTALPGENGNVGLAGHRDGFFRPLARIRLHDEIRLTVEGGRSFLYRVDSTAVVAPSDVSVLAPGSGDSLTLVTCYPFGYIGPAPRRFVVRALRLPI